MKTVIEMAQESGADTMLHWDRLKLERFAALVAEKEREACANVCDFKAFTWKMRPVPMLGYSAELEDCAAAIRARNKNENSN